MAQNQPLRYNAVFQPNFNRGIMMSEENKIKVNDLPNEQGAQEVELPVLNNEGKSESKKEHGESGCCGVCGG